MEEDFLQQTKGRDIDLIVCSDGEAILGIGDQGVGVRILFCIFMTPTLYTLLLTGHRGTYFPNSSELRVNVPLSRRYLQQSPRYIRECFAYLITHAF